jgi:transposase
MPFRSRHPSRALSCPLLGVKRTSAAGHSISASDAVDGVTKLRGIGVQSATVLVREAFVRRFANGKALGSYAGLASSPFSSGGMDREQGIGKAGNRRVRTVMVELAEAVDPLSGMRSNKYCAQQLEALPSRRKQPLGPRRGLRL